MARSRVVGPDLPSGLRRPDRSVSLPDPREQPVQQMGFGEDASSGRIRAPAPHTDHAAWRRAMGTHNDVGLGRDEPGRDQGSLFDPLPDGPFHRHLVVGL